MERNERCNLQPSYSEYCKHLAKENEAQKHRHESDSAVRSHKGDSKITEIESTPGPVKETYMELDNLTTAANEYEMIELDCFTPSDSQKCYNFIRQLKLSSPVLLYGYHRSLSLGTVNWIWKFSVDKSRDQI